jgi:hypothetical protein
LTRGISGEDIMKDFFQEITPRHLEKRIPLLAFYLWKVVKRKLPGKGKRKNEKRNKIYKIVLASIDTKAKNVL